MATDTQLWAHACAPIGRPLGVFHGGFHSQQEAITELIVWMDMKQIPLNIQKDVEIKLNEAKKSLKDTLMISSQGFTYAVFIEP